MAVYLSLCVILFFLSGNAGGFVWDFANMLGYCAVAGLIYLSWESESPASFPNVRLHSNFSLIVTLLVALHILVLLSDEVVIEYLKLKAPLYMLAGVVAAVLIGFLALTSFPRMRKVIYRRFPTFRKFHLIVSTAVILFSVWHVLGSGFYQNTASLRSLLLALTVAIPLVSYWSRRARGKPFTISSVVSQHNADRQGYISLTAAVMMSLLVALLKNY